MSNHLPLSKKILILSMLVEGSSIRSIERITGVQRDTIIRHLVSAGNRAKEIMDSKFQNLSSNFVQCDEIWSFVKKKQRNLTTKEKIKNETGDQYIFVALDADTKLVPYFRIGKRDYQNTVSFLEELKSRVTNRFQLSTDSFSAYQRAVDHVFGNEIDYAQINKSYGDSGIKGRQTEKRYSAPVVIKVNKIWITGNVDETKVSTSHCERQNLTMRMSMRRLTRLTNAFSKKLENHQCAIALHFFYYNFMRIHQTLRVTPCMEHGITNHLWTWEDFLGVKRENRHVA